MTTPEGAIKLIIKAELIARGYLVLLINQSIRRSRKALPVRWCTAYVDGGKQQDKGVFDIIAFRDGEVWALDTKTADGELSEGQELFKREFERQGFRAEIARTIEDFPD